jgi:hypothetical protein
MKSSLDHLPERKRRELSMPPMALPSMIAMLLAFYGLFFVETDVSSKASAA